MQAGNPNLNKEMDVMLKAYYFSSFKELQIHTKNK